MLPQLIIAGLLHLAGYAQTSQPPVHLHQQRLRADVQQRHAGRAVCGGG